MSSIGTLWTVPHQSSGKRIRALVALSGLSVDIPADYKHFEDNKKPEFIAKFASGKIPAFEDKEGFTLFEASAIARYVAGLVPSANLLGSSPKEAALVDQWVSFADTEIGNPNSMIMQLVHGYITPYNKPIHTTMTERQLRSFGTLEKHLSSRTYLVTERITLADVTMAQAIWTAHLITFDAAVRAQHPNIVRFFETVVNHPQLKDIFGEISYIDKAKQYVPPVKDKKEAAPKPAAAPKAEKKPKEKEIDEDEDDNLVPEEPKAKNPLDLLPKSNFNLEDWKRAYSNMDTRGTGGSIEWFYEKFDKEGFSVWRVDYKYNEELTQVFMSSNLIGGFFNRLEASRKYLFGSMGVLGESNNSVISGTLILRGPDAKPVVDVAPDWESYEFKKLDLSNADEKAFFEAALAWDLELDGKKWADGKNFK